MARRSLALVACTLLFVAACSRKPEAPAGSDAGSAPAPPSAPTPPAAGGAPAAAPGQGRNTGTAVDGEATLTAPGAAGAGAVVEVGWTGPGNTGDYIDLAPRSRAEAGGEITYVYTKDAMPVARLRVPTAAGDYNIRYIADLESGRKVKAVAPVAVSPAAATLKAPARAEFAEPLPVAWTGPAGDGDYIDVAPAGTAAPNGEITFAYTSDGNPVTLTAPGKAGAYEVRYILEGPGGRKVIGTAPLEVTQPVATIEAAARVAPSAPFTVTWTGPTRTGDYIDIVKRGHTAPSGELTYVYADRSPAELQAPAEAGEYDIRYVLEAPGGRVVLARRSIVVR